MLGGLQLQIKSGVVKPKGPTLITGTGPLLMLVACQLHAAGVAVAGVYEACEFGRIAKQSLALLNQLEHPVKQRLGKVLAPRPGTG